MSVLTQQNSFRTPVSADTMSHCIELMPSEVLSDFRKFIRKNGDSDWLILSDYHLEDGYKSDVFVFTVLPAGPNLVTPDLIASRLPCKLSKSDVGDRVIEFLQGLNHFTFVFVADKKFRPLGKSIEEVRRQLDGSLRGMKQWVNADACMDLIKSMKRLRNEANAKAFNRKLFNRVGQAANYAACIGMLIATEIRANSIQWVSDRDGITDKWNRIANVIFRVSLSAFLQQRKLPEVRWSECKSESDVVCIPPNVLDSEPLCLDCEPYIRIPDHFAAPIARADLAQRIVQMSATDPKYQRIFAHVVADNPRVAVLRLVTPLVGGWGFEQYSASLTDPAA